MATRTKTDVVEIQPIEVHYATVHIVGDSDLVLNRMNARTVRALTGDRKKVAETPNEWEDIITALHWRDPLPVKDTYAECTEELFYKLLEENAPCFSGFGWKKSVLDAVVQNEIDKYKTKINAALNVNAPGMLIPVKFDKWWLDERLMSPKRGSPVTARLSHFTGWSADVPISFTSNVYSLSEITNFINLAGFGLGVGSGRTSGYGRYHVVDVK